MKKGKKLAIGVSAVLLILVLALLGIVLYLRSLSPRTVVRPISGANIHVEELSYFNGLEKIYGTVYKPQDTLGRKPVLVCCPGLGGTAADWKDICQMVARKGWVAYAFDFRGGAENSRSSGSTLNMTVQTEKADLEMVLKRLLKEEFVDTDHLYLVGHSLGGLVAALVGSGYRNEVAGMVLLAPAFNLPEMCAEVYPHNRDIRDTTFLINTNLGRKFFTEGKSLDSYRWLSRYRNPVLIIHGTEDTIVPIDYAEAAQETFPHATLERMEGVGHAFLGKTGEKMRKLLWAFLEQETTQE